MCAILNFFFSLFFLPNQMPQNTIQLLVISVHEPSPGVLGVLSQCGAHFFSFCAVSSDTPLQVCAMLHGKYVILE